MRYGGGFFDLRTLMFQLSALLQRKKIIILNSDPKLCSEILASSDTKGTFLEQLVATPAWHPIYSIESVDGDLWKQLAGDFSQMMNSLHWRERLRPIIAKETAQLSQKEIITSPILSQLVLRVLFNLIFNKEIQTDDETLFYQASLEWRKEIAVKGKASQEIKEKFWQRLTQIIADSSFKDGLESYKCDPSSWISLFAQPFLISPQINISDIFVAVFYFIDQDKALHSQALRSAQDGDRKYLEGIILEAIRLKHPFPILEREIKKDTSFQGKKYFSGTHFFILLDQFKQDQNFDPNRWQAVAGENPYHSIPFAVGPRMCVGKPIAMELMAELLMTLLKDFPLKNIQLPVGHYYSGRDNDHKTSLKEAWYQIGVFSKILVKSFFLGRQKKTKGKCPISQIL